MKIELSTVWGDGDASRLIREIRSELEVMIRLLMAQAYGFRRGDLKQQ